MQVIPAHSRVRVIHPTSLRECDGEVVGQNADDGSYRIRIFAAPALNVTAGARASFQRPDYFSRMARDSIVSVQAMGPILAE